MPMSPATNCKLLERARGTYSAPCKILGPGGQQIIGASLELDATDYDANDGSSPMLIAFELTDRAVGLEEQRLALITRYVGELRGVLPAVKVGRWHQVEMALDKIVDLRMAAEIPLANIGP